MCTFESNLSRLLSLKKEAQLLTNIYSKDIKNVNHLKSLEQKTQQLKSTYLQIEDLKQKQSQQQHSFDAQIKVMVQKQEATNIEYLMAQQAIENQENKMDELKQTIQQKDQQIHQLELDIQNLQQKHHKDLENQRLMHNQELYILKRKK